MASRRGGGCAPGAAHRERRKAAGLARGSGIRKPYGRSLSRNTHAGFAPISCGEDLSWWWLQPPSGHHRLVPASPPAPTDCAAPARQWRSPLAGSRSVWSAGSARWRARVSARPRNVATMARVGRSVGGAGSDPTEKGPDWVRHGLSPPNCCPVAGPSIAEPTSRLLAALPDRFSAATENHVITGRISLSTQGSCR